MNKKLGSFFQVLSGFVLTLLCFACYLTLVWFFTEKFEWGIWGNAELKLLLKLSILVIGVVQFFYIVPLIFFFKKNEKILRGIELGAGLFILYSCIACSLFIKDRLCNNNVPHSGFYVEKFVIFNKWDQVPASIQNTFKSYLSKGELKYYSEHNTQFKMADPGQPFNETDVGEDPMLPYRRLLFAGESENYSFAYYQKGGIGWSFNLAVFKKTGSKVVLEWYIDPYGKFSHFYLLKLWLKLNDQKNAERNLKFL